jgi:hypothetical protein
MVVQSIQLGNERTELPPLAVIAVIFVVLIALTPTRQSDQAAPVSV